MISNLLNRIGDWNPQLLREIKGRLKPRNILVATAMSVVGQFILTIVALGQLPTQNMGLQVYSNRYCTGTNLYSVPKCFLNASGHVMIDWQLWSQDVFTALSTIGCIALLVAGTYLLINDLANEERRTTLNFIRLSPQSPQSILSGKMLGVPILLYFVVLLAVPLHIWLGFSAKIPLLAIFSLYLVLIVACFFYYSGALVFGLVGSWLGGFQAWLGSGVVLGFLVITQQLTFAEQLYEYPLVMLWMLNPLNSALDPLFINSSTVNFQWLGLSLGGHVVTSIGFKVLVNAIGSYFILQSWQRCFRDPNATMLSKQQSYWLTSWFTLTTVGCANWQRLVWNDPRSNLLAENIICLLLLSFGLSLYLIAALSPHRQTLLDWARYRKTQISSARGNKSLVQDLIWGEKSPGLLAIAINFTIICAAMCILILLCNVDFDYQLAASLAVVLAASIAMFYATIAQVVLLIKNQHRIFWTVGILSAMIVLPVIVATMFSSVGNNPYLWLFSVAAPIFLLSPSGMLQPHFVTLFIAILAYWSIVGFLVFQLTKKLRKAGESETKALLTSV